MDNPGGFGFANYATLVLYFAAMLGVGVWASRRVKSSEGYFIAEGRLPAVLVGLSMLGTYLSATTMMGLPGKAYGPEDLTWSIQLPFLLVTAFVITRFVLPVFRAAGVVSVYQFLEQRIHLAARLLASASFIALSVARMGLAVYLPALAFSQCAGLSLHWSILGMGVVMTVYTVIGGIEAVIWTDAIQVVIFVVAAVYSIAAILVRCAGGDFWAIAAEHHKFRMIEPGFDLSKPVTLWLIVETIFSTIRIYGSQQDMTQRYLTTESTKEANKSVWVAILGYIPLGYLFYFIGAALFVFYQIHPDPRLAEIKPDAIYPYFVATQLPPGLAGLVVAGIFAAAMSTVSSLMNSTSTVCVLDFYKRLSKRERPDADYLKVARWLTVLWGVSTIVLAYAMQNIKSALDTWVKIMGFTSNGVLALMVLAFLPPKITLWPGVIGFVVANLTAWLVTLPGVTQPLLGVEKVAPQILVLVGAPLGVIVGLLAQTLANATRRAPTLADQ
ncbi:MAG: sodium/solute symporter [Fimbriimonadaceae bacterium]|nr:sodium/solute symporter [Fimbriimonadaceae bacterium]